MTRRTVSGKMWHPVLVIAWEMTRRIIVSGRIWRTHYSTTSSGLDAKQNDKNDYDSASWHIRCVTIVYIVRC